MRRPALIVGAALGVLGIVATAAPIVGRVLRSWPHRVSVAGHSMEPTLRAGDWLLVDPIAYARRPPAPAELVVARHPRAPDLLLIKRAGVVTGASASLVSDHPAHRVTDEALGAVALKAICGRPWLRYWPLDRLGRLGPKRV